MDKHIALAVVLMFTLKSFASAQPSGNEPVLSGVTLQAFSYFERIQNNQFDDFLGSIRPSRLTPELRARVLGMLPKDDLLNPDAKELAKLKTLDQLLKYHHRDSFIEIKVLRTHTASALFLAGAAILITEPALKLLTADELQAIVAHELAHEYYWNRFEMARQKKNYSELQELELRCDGIAVIALQHLGIKPETLVSAIVKLNRHNQRYGSIESLNYVAFDERVAFINRMTELVSAKQPSAANKANKKD